MKLNKFLKEISYLDELRLGDHWVGGYQLNVRAAGVDLSTEAAVYLTLSLEEQVKPQPLSLSLIKIANLYGDIPVMVETFSGRSANIDQVRFGTIEYSY